MKKAVIIMGLWIGAFLIALNWVQAKGGGGGGGGTDWNVSCAADQYECSQWGACSLEGQQSRDCKLMADCPNASDPAPITTRSCTPPCSSGNAWQCTDWSVCPSGGRQTRTCTFVLCEGNAPNKPEESQSCNPATLQKTRTPATRACKDEDYQCGNWGACEEDGKQRRSCLAPASCRAATPPTQEQMCPGLRCGHLSTLRQRIECRVKLTSEQTRREQQLLYSPEYCRIEEEAQDKAECINLYWALERCWAMPKGEGRQNCGKEVTGILTYEAEKAACSKKKKAERRECLEALADKQENWTLFQMYEYEFLAEEQLKANKTDLKSVVDFDVFVEKQKAELEKTESQAQWKRLHQKVKKEWDKFLKTKVRGN